MRQLPQAARTFLLRYRHVVWTLIVVIIAGDIIAVSPPSDLLNFTILGLAVVLFLFYRYPARNFFLLSLLPLSVIGLLFPVNPGAPALETSAVWLFILLAAGILLSLFRGTTHEAA
ncbi:hypothetical protein M1555_02840 [Patescibacteria group bacterium]|nr:hypothetical protein [Patescibacteria group bacterium]